MPSQTFCFHHSAFDPSGFLMRHGHSCTKASSLTLTLFVSTQHLLLESQLKHHFQLSLTWGHNRKKLWSHIQKMKIHHGSIPPLGFYEHY
jgi:hypothetical protein